jgi:hypothetical protein
MIVIEVQPSIAVLKAHWKMARAGRCDVAAWQGIDDRRGGGEEEAGRRMRLEQRAMRVYFFGCLCALSSNLSVEREAGRSTENDACGNDINTLERDSHFDYQRSTSHPLHRFNSKMANCFCALPQELQIEILTNLDAVSLVSCAMVGLRRFDILGRD